DRDGGDGHLDERVVDRVLDELGRVAHDHRAVAVRQVHVGERGAHAPGRVDGVATGHLADLEEHGRLAVDAGVRGHVRAAITHDGDVRDPDPAAGVDPDVLDL